MGKLKEEKQKTIKGISKAIYIISKIMRVFCIIGIVGVIIGMAAIGFVGNYFDIDNKTSKFEVFGSEYKYEINNNKITITDSDDISETYTIDNLNMVNLNKIIEKLETHSMGYYVAVFEVLMTFTLAMMIVLVYLLKTIEKLFKNINKQDTPFTLENVGYIRKLSKYMIAMFISTFVFTSIFTLVTEMKLNVTIGFNNILYILIVVVLSYIFEYGYELQKDSKETMYNK